MTRRVAVKRFTCPHHPDGPPTLPAGGFEREELTLGEAYTVDEVVALNAVIAAARTIELNREADTVEQMFGLCCAGHTWEVVSYRTLSPREERMSMMMDTLREMSRPVWIGNNVLLNELASFNVDTQPGTALPIRIPLIRDNRDTEPDGNAGA